MITFSAKQLHENPSKVYQAAAKGPVKITHRNFGEMILSSSDKPHAYIFKQIGDESICYSGFDALAEIAKSRPEEYMKHVTSEMMINYT